MIKPVFLIAFLLVTSLLHSQESPYSLFIKAYNTNDYPTCIENGNRVIQSYNHPFLKYQVATCYAGNGNADQAVSILKELADAGLPYEIASNRWSNLKQHAAYAALEKKFNSNGSVANKSTNAFHLKERLLIPEGITATKDGSTFFISSMGQNKVVKRTDKSEEDFIKSNQDGIWSVVGIKLSPSEKELWVCSFSEIDTTNGYSGLFIYDVSSGKLKRKFVYTDKKRPHLLNDIAFVEEGKAYVTDSKAGKVWLIETDSIGEAFDKQFIYPNGIAYNKTSGLLYIVDYMGITVFDEKSRNANPLTSKIKTYLSGIDGMYLYNNSLIAIQNAGSDMYRVVRFYLNKQGDEIEKVETLQSHHPDFVNPTTGTIVNNTFYYIANSSLRQLQAGAVRDDASVKPPLIKKISLR